MLEEVRRRAWEFDVLHFHTDRLHLPVFADAPWCMVTTLHGRLDRLDEHGFYRKFRHSPFVSISHAQRRSLTGINWAGTVHHGLPPSGASFGTGAGGGGDYLAFLGRISPEKRPDRAIEIASRADLPLRIAAKVAAEDREYFERVIQPLLGHPRVHFIGEITEAQKADFLGNARAMLFPIDWPEPFGLVMVEAMRCGTPVIAFPHGAVPEVVEDGVTGFLVDSVAEAVAAVERLPALDRREVRRRFEQMFSATRMANDYVSVYQRLLRAAVPQLRPAAREIN
jgi:glycosyltransferase involved in cell wall biosynthesis